MEILIWSLAFIASLAVLIKAADIFTDNSQKLGLALGIPQFIIGVSIVALGTSLPELVTSVLSTIQGYSSITTANVVGSNIANILLVIGIPAIMAKKLVFEKNLIKLDLPILFAVTSILIVTIYDGTFTFAEGLILMLTYCVYIAYNFSEHRQNKVMLLEKKIEQKVDEAIHSKKKENHSKMLLFIFLSALGVFVGSKYTIDSIINLSELLNLAPSAIAISAVAIGTSLPELMVGISAAKKKNFELIIGNVIGSNIFNATVVMSAASFFGPLNVTSDVLTIAVPYLIIATILFTFSGIERKVFSFEGALYGILYFLFIGQLFNFL
ncbi:MAG: cation:H+ antiporter [Oceanicoccus sp.]|jgi:cation:H+ antiporter